MCQPTKYYRMLEVPVNGTKGEFALPLDEVLRDACKITAIEAYPPTSLVVSPVTGSAVVNSSVFNKATITLQTKDDQDRITDVPLQRINPANNNGMPFRIDTPGLNVTKCRIRVGNTTGLVVGEVFVIGVTYEK